MWTENIKFCKKVFFPSTYRSGRRVYSTSEFLRPVERNPTPGSYRSPSGPPLTQVTLDPRNSVSL